MWYHRKIGGERCPIVDTWWQTETGGIMMTPAARRHSHQARQLHQAVAGHHAGDRRRGRQTGRAGARRLAGDHPSLARHASRHLGRRRALQGPVLEQRARHSTSRATTRAAIEDGYYWIMGRIDDVLNVSGHRLSTIEIESALVSHPLVAEAAAVGRPDDLKGEAVAVFVTAQDGPGHRSAAQGTAAARPQGNRRPGRTRTTSASPPPCPKPAAARSCGGCCETSPPAKNRPATPRRWKTTACWPNSAATINKFASLRLRLATFHTRISRLGLVRSCAYLHL